MHRGNRDWLTHLKARFADYFAGAKVLEIGSYDVNGTARDYFQSAGRYVGVDQVPGPGVDVVAKARETSFAKGEFDTLVYLSVFEHDPDWASGFAHNLQWIRPGGLIILGWGAEGNNHHGPEPWAIVPHREVLDQARTWPIHILESFFEAQRFTGDCPGAYDLLAKKNQATLSMITPTIGRDSLRVMLNGLVPQLEEGDEAIVIGDGPQPNARRIVESYACPRIIYLEHGPILNYGNPQRNLAMGMARGQYLFFIDDDDQVLPDCLKGVRRVIGLHPGSPLMFRMHHGTQIIFTDHVIRGGNVSGQMFITPNDPARLGRWSGRYAADYDFITSTLAKYPDGQSSVVWRPELVAIQGLAGKSPHAHEM